MLALHALCRHLPVRPACALALLLAGACASGPAREAPAQQAPPPAAPPAASTPAPAGEPAARGPLHHPEERRLRNVRQLTDGGENAEAYWSWSGNELVYQARTADQGCDRIHVMRADGSASRTVAARGAHTCSYFLPDDERILFSSTLAAGDDCPAPPDRSQGYVWPLHEAYDIYTCTTDGTDVQRLTTTPGYDAEATVGPGGRIVFTSARDGDLDIYTMALDGSDVRRLTHTPGYDGGPFYSPDGQLIVYRAAHPTDPDELADYQGLLARHLVRPGQLDIWIMAADGSEQRRVTDLGGASFAPFFTPDGRNIIFSSNHENPRGRNFDLYLVALDGTALERVTFDASFDGFPMFSPDGKRLAFASNRANSHEGETNVFVADWQDLP